MNFKKAINLASKVILLLFILIINDIVGCGRVKWSEEKNPEFWNDQARIEIEQALRRQDNRRIAKNVIIFLGDGMGVSTITAGRIRKGQIRGELGEDFVTEMEQFAYSGFVKTYNIDYQTPDSAATATAFLCGVKAQMGTIGVDGRAIRGNCQSSIGTHVESILEWAQKLGKKVGVITTSSVTDGTPAATYAHTPERYWESYDSINFDAKHASQGCVDISHQLVSRSPPIDLMLGGGRRYFFPNTTPDIEYPNRLHGSRTDNISLIDDKWQGHFVWNLTELNKIVLGSSAPVLGLFEHGYMHYETDRLGNANDEPSLSRMARFAVDHLSAMNKGFFLLIEGGRIDHGHHDTKARYALDEFVEFDNTIGQVKTALIEKGLLDDTLLVVTADHSHVFTIGADSSRGSNILGFSTLEQLNVSDVDQSPVNILAYGNGPNFNSSRNISHLIALNTNSTDYLSPAALPLQSETHGGEDVAVFASGPWSHLFTGTMEQHTIAHKMAYAACWGAYATRDGCESKANGVVLFHHSTANRSSSLLLVLLVACYFSQIQK